MSPLHFNHTLQMPATFHSTPEELILVQEKESKKQIALSQFMDGFEKLTKDIANNNFHFYFQFVIPFQRSMEALYTRNQDFLEELSKEIQEVTKVS